ncbi:subclass B1 metallo-beta-lactamase [Psychroserpens ponticola]|uniref:beta-lactamase n=1 Tax=Psychroserpens ponticola TaxID=2932268 RepID=A0ABY7RT82_9FLAO|nr:subclass B1 metallo-beta-lactamase [Psychroserpens ponticola]WCO00311.1 subclass B1 metallo-beta-lactamase [Psychroserpens ponticola]
MKNKIFILGIITIFISCNSNNTPSDIYHSEHLKIEKITKNLYKHISFLNTQDYGKVPCNGIIYFNNNEAVIFDTPSNDKASAELINWIGKRDIKAIIATHFHIDCLGGLNEFHSKGIKSYAHKLTIKLAKENNKVLPQNGFEKQLEMKVGNEIVLAKHFGEGHTKDNIIAYIESEKAIFGGCLIKEMGSGKGNLEDANIKEWPKTVSKIKDELTELEIVIPGHGKTGNNNLLDYTIELFTEN